MVNPEKGEGLRQAAEVTASFGTYADEQVARYNGLSNFLTENLPIAEDLDQCNGALEAAGRPDLAITERAEMLRVDSPEEIPEKCNNFMKGMRMYTDRIEHPEGSYEGPTLIPITKDGILALKALPKIESYEHIQEIKDSGDFTLPFNVTPVFKPAFLRMLTVFPDFTVDLITRMSQAENRNKETRLEPELFVAYHLMSRLVDEEDLYVKDEKSGAIDRGYISSR